jgi:hypothetical protein
MTKILRRLGAFWEAVKLVGLVLWPSRFIVLVLLAMIAVLSLTQAQDAMFGAVIEWEHPWLFLTAVTIWAVQTWYWARFLLYLPPLQTRGFIYTRRKFRRDCYSALQAAIPRALGVLIFLIVGWFLWWSSAGKPVDGLLWGIVYAVLGALFYLLTSLRRFLINRNTLPAVGALRSAHRVLPTPQLGPLATLNVSRRGLQVASAFALVWVLMLVLTSSSAILHWGDTGQLVGSLVMIAILLIASVVTVVRLRLGTGMAGFILLMIGFDAFLFVVSVLWPGRAGMAVGPAVVLMLDASVWVGATSFFIAFPGQRLRLPVATLLVLGIMTFAIVVDNIVGDRGVYDNHAVRVATPSEPVNNRDRQDLNTAFSTWYEQAPCVEGASDCERKPVIIVVVEGGASRSAYWSAMILGAIEDAYPEFQRSVFAISAVSGGALGAAVFQRLLAIEGKPQCPDVADPSSGYAVCAEKVLKRDFLGAAFSSMFGSDLLQRLLPGALLPDRATALETAWEIAWNDAMKNDDFAQPFRLRMNAETKPSRKWLPVLLLNGTSVKTGRRMITSDVALDTECRSAGTAEGEPQVALAAVDFFCLTGKPIRLSTAVHNSARFPYISPAGTLWAIDKDNVTGSEVSWKADRIVDGGYFEALGATTLSDLLELLQPWKVDPIVVVIQNDPNDRHPPDCGVNKPLTLPCHADEFGNRIGDEGRTMTLRMRLAGDAFAPPIGLAASRTGRGTYAELALRDQTPGAAESSRFLRFNLMNEPQPADTVDPAMSWYLSARSLEQMERDFCGGQNEQVQASLTRLGELLPHPDSHLVEKIRGGPACGEIKKQLRERLEN